MNVCHILIVLANHPEVPIKDQGTALCGMSSGSMPLHRMFFELVWSIDHVCCCDNLGEPKIIGKFRKRPVLRMGLWTKANDVIIGKFCSIRGCHKSEVFICVGCTRCRAVVASAIQSSEWNCGMNRFRF